MAQLIAEGEEIIPLEDETEFQSEEAEEKGSKAWSVRKILKLSIVPI